MSNDRTEKVADVTLIEDPATAVKQDPTYEDARHGIELEHEMTVRECLEVYWPAVLWSVAASGPIIMESYDLQIIGSFYALPQFQRKYGVEISPGKYAMQPQWQVALSLSSSLGIILGILANGWLVDRFGHKKLLQISLLSLIGFIFITFFAPSKEILLVGELLCGFPWGICNTIAPNLAAEFTPMKLRGYLTTYVNLCWVIGHIIGAGILKGMNNVEGQWAYKIPFAIQWVWPVPLFILVTLAPHSPWWLVRKGRITEAEHSLRRLTSSRRTDVKDTLAMIQHTIQLETELQIGHSYRECFKGTNLRRTEIATVAWGSQALVGWCLQSYVTFFFTQAGLPTSQSFKLGLGSYCIAFAGTFSSWFTQTYFGRRTIYLIGCAVMGTLMFIIGLVDLAPRSDSTRWAQAALLLVWFAGYGATVGPMPYVIAAEISAAKLRAKTIAISRDTYYVLNVVNAVMSPYMINATAWNMRGKAAFPAAVFNTLLFVWAFFRLPEAKNKTYAELDDLFEKRVPAREFSKYTYDPARGLVRRGE